MKIAFIVSMKFGLTKFMLRDIKALADKGHEARLFTLRNARGLYNPLPDWIVVSVNWLRIFLSQFWLLLRKPDLYLRLLFEALRSDSITDLAIAVDFAGQMTDIDVIYAYFGDHKLFVGYYCKKITGIPLVVTIRAYELHKNPNPRMFVRALADCSFIHTVSEYNKEIMVGNFEVPPDRVEVVRQMIDLDAFAPAKKIKILIVGFFAEKKGHEVLFEALKRLNRDDVELWVVGDVNPSVAPVDCRQLAKKLGLESQIAFFGMQHGTALRALYRESDIFCLPSRTTPSGNKEGFPNAIAEAMAFGKPVVTTRHAGIPEVVEAIIVDENNEEQLADALQLVCNSIGLRQKLGSRNRQIVENLFSAANNDRLEEVLSICAKNRN